MFTRIKGDKRAGTTIVFKQDYKIFKINKIALFAPCGVAIACNQADTEGVLDNSRALSKLPEGSPTSFWEKGGHKNDEEGIGNSFGDS